MRRLGTCYCTDHVLLKQHWSKISNKAFTVIADCIIREYADTESCTVTHNHDDKADNS